MNKKIFLTIGILFFTICSRAQLEVKQNTFKQISQDEVIMEGNRLNLGDQTYLFKEKVRDRDGILCAIVKLRIDKIAFSDIQKLNVVVDPDVEIVRKEAKTGQLWIFMTGKKTNFSVEHPSFGRSNKVLLEIKSEKIYEIQLTNGETADISFYSNPIGADIYVNNEWKGKTTEKGVSVPRLPYGNHTIKAKLSGKEEVKQIEITQTSDRSYYFNVMQTKTFHFNSDPQGAALFIDGTKVGTTPKSCELTLEFHTIKASLGGEEDSFDRNFADPNLSNTFTLSVIKKKAVQIVAKADGQAVNASVEIDNKALNDKTPVTEKLTYGKHKVTAQYYGRSKTKNINVSENGKSHFELKLPSKSSITWPWERDIDVRPAGLSLGYVQKQWVGRYGNEKVKWGFWDGYDYLHGIQTGIRLNFHFWGGIGMNTGLFYEFYYSKSESFDVMDDYGYYYGDGYAEMMEHSLYLPVHLEYRFQISNAFQIFFNGGLGLDCGLFASMDCYLDGESNPYFSEEDIYGKEDFNNYKRFNVSSEFGGGIRIKSFQLNFNMSKGLINQSSEEGVIVKQNKMMISASLMF